MATLDYSYDGQIRRFEEQLVRAFSGFQYKTGRRDGFDGVLKVVPCRLALRNRQVANILRNNSENSLLVCPMITIAITAMSNSRERTQYVGHVDIRQVTERKIDPATGQYTGEEGNAYTVERLMPRPLEATIQVDLWTSNEDQKRQLFEQIYPIFHPGIEIQNSDNPLDWSALTTMMLEDITWLSRSIEIGTDDAIDVLTLTFKLPFWLTPPAKVTQQRIIQQIITNIYTATDPQQNVANDDLENTTLIDRLIVTPGDHHIEVVGNEVTLLGPGGKTKDETGAPYSWSTLLKPYGSIRPGVSTLRLKTTDDIDNTDGDIVGTFVLDPVVPNLMHWTLDIDTLPANTLSPVDAIIDPRRTFPGNGLPSVVAGQRYLFLESIGANTQAWGTLAASANDVVQYTGSSWVVSFDASADHGATQYVTNLFNSKQLKFVGGEWIMAIDGEYHPAYWRLFL